MAAAVERLSIEPDRYIVNHDIMHCTAEGVVGNHLYSGRALGISEPRDIIQLRAELKPDWESITAHYDRIGLSYASEVIWHVDMNFLGKCIGYYPSVFYFGPGQYINWGDTDWLSTVEYINSKNNFIDLAQELNVPIPQTIGFNSVRKIDEAALESVKYPCYLKAAVSVSGVGIYRCADKLELQTAMKQFDDLTPVQIQEEIRAKTFLNMQYRVQHGYAERLACTEQILDGFAHQGNKYPACCEPWDVADPIAHWLAERGIKGIFALDVSVIENGESYDYAAIECNPRYNGASYPTIIANKLGIDQWVAKTFDTKHTRLKDIPIKGLEFSRKSAGKGVVIVNWGTISHGKLMVLIAGNEIEQAYYEQELKKLL